MLEKLPYKDAVEDHIKRITEPDTLNMPVGKTALARMAQQFALTRYAFNIAKGLYEDSRLTLINKIKGPVTPGDYTLCDTPQVILVAQVTEAPRRLNEAALLDMLMERMDIEQDEAQALIDGCKIPGDPVIKLQVTPKR